jgi:cytochrome c oxidase subunit 3
MNMKSITTARGNPYLTIVWLAILGSALLFLFLVFILFFRAGSADWVSIPLPIAFFYSSFAIGLSSFSLHLANRSFTNEYYSQFFSWLLVTVVLAISFCLLQVNGWNNLVKAGIKFQNIGGAFVYIITGLHLLHLFLGLFGLAWVLVDSYKNRRYVDGFILSLNPAKTAILKIVTIFWHFLGGLWLILFLLLWMRL